MKRRHFLQTTAGATLASLSTAETSAPKAPLSYFLIGDTHYRADEAAPDKMLPASTEVTSKLIDWLNKLPGTEFPAALGGGKIADPLGVIHAGDLIDSGDKNGEKFTTMQKTELAAFTADWGLNGGDGKLKWPVREIHGNHDSPGGKGLVIDAICARNKNRKSLANVSENGLHYSWDWNGVHFINLGIVVGQGKDVNQKRRYSPMNSLEFLISDLKSKVGESGKPVVITHHVDMIRYVADTPNSTPLAKEWDAGDVKAFYAALKGYKIAAINYGHTHVRNVFHWAGGPKIIAPEKSAIPVFNTDNASHFNSKQQAFLHFTITEKETIVREFGTTDSWQTGTWKDQMWKFPI